MFFVFIDGAHPSSFVSLLVPFAMHLAGCSPSLVMLGNIASFALASQPAIREQIYMQCRRWLLDGRARLEMLRTLRNLLLAAMLLVIVGLVFTLVGQRKELDAGHVLMVISGVLVPCVTLTVSWMAINQVAFHELRTRALADMRSAAASVSAHMEVHFPTYFMTLMSLGPLTVLWVILGGPGNFEGRDGHPPFPGYWTTMKQQWNESSRWDVIMGAGFVLSICWPMLLVTGFLILMPHRFMDIVGLHRRSGQPRPARREQIDAIEQFDVAEKHFFTYQLLTTPCAVCLERHCIGERAARLKCGHTFHSACVMPWLERRSGTCPTCRATV